jgi:hypothetical protein
VIRNKRKRRPADAAILRLGAARRGCPNVAELQPARRVPAAHQIKYFQNLYDLHALLGHRPSVGSQGRWNAFEAKRTAVDMMASANIAVACMSISRP